MPYFDNSIQCSPKNQSKIKTFHSYMCPSKQEYLSNKCTGTENFSQDQRLRENITKLRHILSETISNLTRENNLKKGESVELTLEIDLMKSFENTPTNSLVEVTIIQHINKHESNKTLNKLPNKMVFKTENVNTSMDKTSSLKRQVRFNGENKGGKTASKELRSKEVEPHESGDCRKHIHKPLSCLTANQRLQKLNNIGNHDARSEFIRILPEQTTHTENFPGYQKVSQRKKCQKLGDSINTVQVSSKKVCKKSSLMKKISEIFLPPKKPCKDEKVTSALTALKNEIDYMKRPTDEKEKLKHSEKRDTAPVHNLGKLINNILFDVMESMDDDSKNKQDDLSLPLEYHRFFEPVSKTSKKHKEEKILKRKTSPSIQKLYRSHSDTCCVRPLKSDTEPKLKTSNSISDCKAYRGTETQPQAEFVGDTKQRHNKRRKRSNQRDYSRSRKKNMNRDNRVVPNKTADDNKTNFPHQRSLLSRSSLIQWNGRYVKVSKDIKARIEMLIVNELENLALKEGMECDVTPLSSTDNTSKDSTAVEKISSFMCELDISDKNVRKIMKKKKSLHNKVSVHHSEVQVKMDHLNPKPKGRTCTTLMSSSTQPAQCLDKQTKKINKTNNKLNHKQTIKNEENSQDLENNSILANISDIEQNSVEVKYMNDNAQNWSAESQTITLDSPEVDITPKKNMVSESVDRDKTSNKNNKFVSTGFVKIIKSDDSTWNECYTRSNISRCTREIIKHDVTTYCLNSTEQTTSATGNSNSKTSNELDCCIEIELDIQDLKYILQEAKNSCNADKVLIEAKGVCPVKKHKSLKLTGKNTPSYTNHLLTNAAKKLEKYTKTKSRNKKSKH